MKKIFVIVFFKLCVSSFAQDNKMEAIKVDSIVSDTTEVKRLSLPSPDSAEGGEDMKAFILKNIKISNEMKECGYSGSVIISFFVDVDGSVNNVKLYRGIDGCPECDKEALRVVRMMPKFVPATNNGIPFKVQVNLPINFKLK